MTAIWVPLLVRVYSTLCTKVERRFGAHNLKKVQAPLGRLYAADNSRAEDWDIRPFARFPLSEIVPSRLGFLKYQAFRFVRGGVTEASGTVGDGGDSGVSLRSVTKRFGDFTAVDSIDLDIHEGEFFTMLGPSGCGKTTTLRMIAGFEQPDGGEVLIDGVNVAGLPAHKRPTNTVFQSYALFPHLSVKDNVAYGLKRKGVDKGETERRVQAELERVGLWGEANRRPNQLSGGQQQRVALGPRRRQPAEGAASRRAARRPRPEASQGSAGRAQAHPAGDRNHVRIRDPRSGGGADDVRPDRGHEPRHRRADRRPGRGLRATRRRLSSPASSASRT